MQEKKQEFTLRTHQQDTIEDINAHIEMFGTEKMMIWAPPSYGKTALMAEIARQYQDDGVAIVVNISELLSQISATLDIFGVKYSILKAGDPSKFDKDCKVQLIMAQTLYARKDKIEFTHKFRIYQQDEAHRENSSKRTTQVIKTINPEIQILYSGTPWDNEGFRFSGSELIPTVEVLNLQEKGFLAPIKYLVPKWAEKVDYSRVDSTSGDYSVPKLEEITNADSHLIAARDAMNQCNAKEKVVLVFCSSIEQCDKFAKILQDDGYAAYANHSQDGNKFSEEIIEAFKKGTKFDANKINSRKQNLFSDEYVPDMKEVRCIVSVNKLGIGFDAPRANFGVMLRPTKVYSLYLQQIMRHARLYRPLDKALEKYKEIILTS